MSKKKSAKPETPSFHADLQALREKWPQVYLEAWTPDDFDFAVAMREAETSIIECELEACHADWNDPKHVETARRLDRYADADCGTNWYRVADAADRED